MHGITKLDEKKGCGILFTHLHFHLGHIYRPTQSIKPTKKEISTKEHISQSSSSLNVMAASVSSVLVPVIPSHEAHSSRISVSSPSRSTTKVSASSGTGKRSSKITKQNMYIILACGIGGGIVMIIIITVIIYLRR